MAIQQKRSRERLEAILEAALRCFRAEGFHGASISRICAETGISAGHLYHSFDSKEAIVSAFDVRLRPDQDILARRHRHGPGGKAGRTSHQKRCRAGVGRGDTGDEGGDRNDPVIGPEDRRTERAGAVEVVEFLVKQGCGRGSF